VTYTQIAIVAVVYTLALDLLVLRTGLVRRKAFWVAYGIVLCFQIVANAILTAPSIVRYNASDVIGTATPYLFGHGRFAYAPVEDLLFGFALVTQAMVWWVFWGRRGLQRGPSAGPPRTRAFSCRASSRAGAGPRGHGDSQSS
jgi:lycopene cyclase domain-containing protein